MRSQSLVSLCCSLIGQWKLHPCPAINRAPARRSRVQFYPCFSRVQTTAVQSWKFSLGQSLSHTVFQLTCKGSTVEIYSQLVYFHCLADLSVISSCYFQSLLAEIDLLPLKPSTGLLSLLSHCIPVYSCVL